MGRIRHANPNEISESTSRTMQSRFLLRPSEEVNELILGCVAKAQQVYPVDLHGFVFMSNHYHLLATAVDAARLSAFIGHLNGNVARELNRVTGWSGHFWQRRFRAIPVDGDEASQLARLRYMLSHGVKERLVRRVRDWPGASSHPWMLDGEEVHGIWVDRTAMYYACRRKTDCTDSFRRRMTVKFKPLPCFEGLSDEQWRERVACIVDDIEAESAQETERLEAQGLGKGDVVGADAVLAMDPLHRPEVTKQTVAPRVHCVDRDRRIARLERIRQVEMEYVASAVRWRRGDFDVVFPAGTFRPNGGFVPWPDDDCSPSTSGADSAIEGGPSAGPARSDAGAVEELSKRAPRRHLLPPAIQQFNWNN